MGRPDGAHTHGPQGGGGLVFLAVIVALAVGSGAASAAVSAVEVLAVIVGSVIALAVLAVAGLLIWRTRSERLGRDAGFEGPGQTSHPLFASASVGTGFPLTSLYVWKHWSALLRGTQWTIGVIAAVVLGLAIAWVLFVPVSDWIAHHDVGQGKGSLHETAVDNARGRLLTLGAGLFAAGALVFTARNFALSRQGQVTDRYTKAIEQLSSDKLNVRIGGIYALERLARDSARDHREITLP